jgi:hypothetical protein
MHIKCHYGERGASGTHVRSAVITTTARSRQPVAVIGFKFYSPSQLDGVFVTESRDVRQIEWARRAGFRVHGPEFLSRTPHPGAAEKDPDHTGAGWW